MVEEKEYIAHKAKCAKSFEEIIAQLEKMERAMFGEEELDQKGVLEMTKEMYRSMMFAKGNERLFWTTAKVAGAVLTIVGAILALWEFFKRGLTN